MIDSFPYLRTLSGEEYLLKNNPNDVVTHAQRER